MKDCSQLDEPRDAPEWETSGWLNTAVPLHLADLRGKVVFVHAFQMLCPGCVEHGLPQARRVCEQLDDPRLCVVGLHCVFEHHAVTGRDALKAFVHEYRINFPIGIDASSGQRIPRTMQAYGMRGTPTTLLIDARGALRLHAFGVYSDLRLGAAIATLLSEAGVLSAAEQVRHDVASDSISVCGSECSNVRTAASPGGLDTHPGRCK